MPYSDNQLEERCSSACDKIDEARQFTREHLLVNINFSTEAFYDHLETSNLVDLQAGISRVEQL